MFFVQKPIIFVVYPVETGNRKNQLCSAIASENFIMGQNLINIECADSDLSLTLFVRTSKIGPRHQTVSKKNN